jgi:two-component system C4-dicarboxylate transport sensor histidine kinase DctB
LAQLAAGLAHEIRNPLHALRINLHTLRRSFTSRSPLPQDQVIATIQESDASIDRLNELMRDLLQFVDPSAGEPADVDLVHEAQATLNLLSDDLRREQITVHTALPREAATIAIDPVRLRQTLLNVFTFAQHRAERSGTIEVQVERCEGGVQIAIGDSGPALTDEQRVRVFEPFQAPAETGSGLGLALVQTYVEEAGGRVCWVGEAEAGGQCRLWFPLTPQSLKGDPS